MKLTRGSAKGDYQDIRVSPSRVRAPAPETVAKSLVKAPASASAAAYACPFANEERNSRLARALPAGQWREAWHAEVRSDFRPRFVLQQGERIVIQAGVWQLLDRVGKPISAARSGPAPIAMDTDRNAVYFIDQLGQLAAYKLGDGKPYFTALVNMGDEGSYSALARRDHFLLTAASERQLDPHGHHKASTSRVEIIDMGDPVQVNDQGLLASIRTVGSLSIDTITLYTALHDQSVVLAIPDYIVRTDWQFAEPTAVMASFTPLAMSVDETGAAYVVVRVGDAGPALWKLAPSGERLFAAELPAEMAEIMTPPVISHDHKVYLVCGRRLAAVSKEGTLVWEHKAEDEIGGAVITGDDQLLVAEGSEVRVFDDQGQSRVLCEFGHEKLCTPPILTDRDELLVASTTMLHCMKAK